MADLFGKSFSVFGRHFVVFTTLAAVVLSPFYLMLFAAVLLRPDRNLGYAVVNLSVMLMLIICPTIAIGAMTYGVIQDLSGRPVRILEMVRVLVRRFPPMICLAIVLLPLVPVSLLLTLIAWGAIAVFFQSVAAEPRYLLGLSVLLLILSYCTYFAAAPVCIAEQAGIGVSLSCSRFLTRGHRWQIFRAVTLIFVCDLIVGFMARMIATRIGADAGLVGADTERLIAFCLVQAVFLAFIAVVAAVLDRQLRVAKGGSDIASVFD